MLSDDLKEQTKTNHQLLEKKLVAKMRAIRSTAGYGNLLSVFYSYFGGLELLIDKHLNTEYLPDYGHRRKASALITDLAFLGTPLPALAGQNALPVIENHLQAMGALYVIEGSTLGGKIIAAMIGKQLGITKGLSFFESYGENTMLMWEKFKTVLNLPGNIPADALIESANETFLKFGEWFDISA
jgi:heme oxygenase